MLVPLLFASVALSAATYSDDLARNKMLPMSAAAYSTKPADCIGATFKNATLKRQLNVFCDATMIDKCSGFTAVSQTDQAIILSYRGTNRNIELVMEADETMLKNHTAWVAGGKVSKFFDDGFTRLWKQGMKDDLLSLTNKYPKYQLWITGHSLGGAMAVLAASFIAHTNVFPAAQITLVTFGEPRTGDSDFAAAVDKEVKNAFRVTHYKDMVPHLPLKNEEGYRQHKTEVYYKEDMGPGAKFTICSDADESMRCSDGNIVDPSIKDHLTYFTHDISEYGVKGCKA